MTENFPFPPARLGLWSTQLRGTVSHVPTFGLTFPGYWQCTSRKAILSIGRSHFLVIKSHLLRVLTDNCRSSRANCGHKRVGSRIGRSPPKIWFVGSNLIQPLKASRCISVFPVCCVAIPLGRMWCRIFAVSNYVKGQGLYYNIENPHTLPALP